MCTGKISTLSQSGAEKIAFPPKPDIRADISNYKVSSLLNMHDYVLIYRDIISQIDYKKMIIVRKLI